MEATEERYWDVTVLVQVRAPNKTEAQRAATQILAQTDKAAVISKAVLRCTEDKEPE